MWRRAFRFRNSVFVFSAASKSAVFSASNQCCDGPSLLVRATAALFSQTITSFAIVPSVSPDATNVVAVLEPFVEFGSNGTVTETSCLWGVSHGGVRGQLNLARLDACQGVL